VTLGLRPLAPAPGCDCSSCPFFKHNPRAVQPICSGCNTDCSYCGCARSGGGAKCSGCPIRCGSRMDIGAWMTDVGGTFAFDDVVLDKQLPAELPRFIPQVDDQVGELDPGLNWPAYAIGLRRVVSPETLALYPRFAGRPAREALGLAEGQLVVLVGYGDDPLVEAVWTRRASLLPAIAEGGWDVVLTPNFSLYGNQPRTEHLLNFRRNLLIAAELQAFGVVAVPNVYWFRREDLDRYVAWMRDVAPPAIAINLQTFRSNREWADMALPGLTYLSLRMPAATKLIATGTSRAGRLRTLIELFGDRLVVVSQNPVQYARHGAVMTSEGRRECHAHTRDLFAANVDYYANLLEEGINGKR
jgi:hypothetical protein